VLNFDEQMNLVNRGLAIMKNDGKYTTFKYHRRAMYEYLWFNEYDLHECRGHVYDSVTKELVQAAPRKSFNYKENDLWWAATDLDTPVEVYKKINGYMACATLHNNELVVSTTGSTTSEYAQWAKELILNEWWKHAPNIEKESTTLFEVVVPQDPHIVAESMGLHLLGFRDKASGTFSPHNLIGVMTLAEAIALAETDRGEGFMIYRVDCAEKTAACKLKTPYYVGKKKLMRMSAKNIEIMFNNPTDIAKILPRGWYNFPLEIWRAVTKDDWLSFNDQERRAVLEEIEGK
jgi:hypothetical protein